MQATQQILFKQKVLLEQLQHFGNIQPDEILPPLTGPHWGYRHRARLSVKYVDKNNTLVIGFHEKNGRYVADLASCDVLDPKVGQLIKPLKTIIMQLSNYRQISQVDITIAENCSALLFRHCVNLTDKDKVLLIQFGQQYDFHIYLQGNSSQPLACIWPDNNEHLLNYTLPDHGISLAFKPTDFTQINPVINKKW
jgi:23S rRNA (uracil1939-C5)-methyltransferase